MVSFLFYFIFSSSLFASVLVKVMVSQWGISSQAYSLTNNANNSNNFTISFIIQIFESFFNSKFYLFTFINFSFALSCQTIISSLQFFLDGLTTNQKSEAKKRFISMALKDVIFPILFLVRYLIEYSYSSSFMFIFPIPFLIRYLTFLTGSFVDGLSISSKSKDRKYHQKLFAFQTFLFTISYIFLILFLSYYFYPNKFLCNTYNSQNGDFESSLHYSFLSNLNHESKIQQNIQYIIERIASLKVKRIQKNNDSKKIKNELTDEEKFNEPDITNKKSSEENLMNNRDEITKENNNKNDSTVKNDENKNKTNNNFYSSDDLVIETKGIRSAIFIFLSFHCCYALIDTAYDISRHIIFISDIDNDGNNEQNIKKNYINDIVFEVIKTILEITFFFIHISYVITNLNNSMPSIKQISSIRKISKLKINLNVTSNSSNQSNLTSFEAAAANSFDSFTEFTSSIRGDKRIPSFQKEIIGIALFTPIFIVKSLILNSFILASKILRFKRWKKISNAIRNNLPDAEEEDMRNEMRCIICRLNMCKCKRISESTKKTLNRKRVKRKVKKAKIHSSSLNQNKEITDSSFSHDNHNENINNNHNENINNNHNENINDNHNENINDNHNENINDSHNENINDTNDYDYEYDESFNNHNNIEYIIRKGEIKKLPCGHCFHVQCLQNWTQRQMKCPLCQYDMKNILNRTLMMINQINPNFLQNENNRQNIQEIQRQIAPNMFIPLEFIREEQNRNNNDQNQNHIHDHNDEIIINERRNEINNENEHVLALRILTHTMLILTSVLFIVLIALIASILIDVIDF